MPELVLYLDVAASDAQAAQELSGRLKELPEVANVDVQVEENERGLGPIDITSITLTLTAVSGAVGAATLLINKVQGLIKSIRGVRQALVETPTGPKPLDAITAEDLAQK